MKQEMTMIAIDSSAKTISIAICQENRVLASLNLGVGVTHSKTLFPSIDSLLKFCSLTIKDINAFAVSVGPGSFTGLRIGIASVKGMAYSQNIPCIGVSTLMALAYNQIDSNAVIAAVMDARRQQVYNAMFEAKDGSLNRLTPDRALGVFELKTEIEQNYKNKRIILVGDGAEMCYNQLKDNKNICLSSLQNRFQNASSVAALGFYLYHCGKFTDAFKIAPNYIRLSQAERIRNEKPEKK